MKRHIKTFYTTTALCVGLLCGSFLCTSCEDEKTVDSYLELEDEYQTTFSPTADEAEYRITVRSNRPWQVVKKDSDADWVRPFPDEGEADGIFTLYVDENPTFETRRTELALVVDGEEYPVLLTVDQAAAVPTIQVGDGSGTVSVAAGAGDFTLTSSANVEWTCVVDEAAAEWLTYNGIDEDGVLSFTVTENLWAERTGIVHCVSEAEPSANVDITVVQASNGVILQEAFNWLAYGSATTWETTGETRYDSWTADERGRGWTSSPADASGNPCLYARQGFVKLGKTNYAGDLISPKLSTISGTADVQVTFKACAYVSKGGAKDDNELYVSVLGAGTLEGADEPYIISNYPNSSNMEYGPDYDVWAPELAERTFIIRGATSETQIKFMGGKSYNMTGIGQGKNRIFLDDILVQVISD